MEQHMGNSSAESLGHINTKEPTKVTTPNPDLNQNHYQSEITKAVEGSVCQAANEVRLVSTQEQNGAEEEPLDVEPISFRFPLTPKSDTKTQQSNEIIQVTSITQEHKNEDKERQKQ